MNALRTKLVFFLGWTALSLAARAEPGNAHVSGRAYTDQFFYTQDRSVHSGSMAQSSYSFWLAGDAHTSNEMLEDKRQWGAKAVLQTDAFAKSQDEPSHPSLSFHVREAYGSFSNDSFDVKLGQQLIPWGKSDGVNPTDYFTAKDYTRLNPDEEVKRIGAPAMNIGFTPNHGSSPLNFQAIVQAYYPQTRLLIPDQAIPQGFRFTKYPDEPAAFSDSMEYGFKTSYLASGFDVSLSYFEGFNHYPQYFLNSASLSVAPLNVREKAVGGDASFTWGDSVIRFESALLLPDRGGKNDPLYGLVQPAHGDAVLGIERPVGSDFRLQVQGFIRQYLDFKNPNDFSAASPLVTQVQRAVGRANALLLNFQDRTSPGATFRVSFAKEESLWTADVFLLGYFSGAQSFLFRPQLSCQPWENSRLLLGMDLYGGSPSKPLGALHDQSTVFFEGRYLF